MMFELPSPRSGHSRNSNLDTSGTKFVSHMCLPGRLATKSPSPEKWSALPSRSGKRNRLSKMNASLWKQFIISGAEVEQASLAFSVPDPLKWRYLQLSGKAKTLFGPHSKLWVRPSAVSTVVLPRPDST